MSNENTAGDGGATHPVKVRVLRRHRPRRRGRAEVTVRLLEAFDGLRAGTRVRLRQHIDTAACRRLWRWVLPGRTMLAYGVEYLEVSAAGILAGDADILE